MSMVDEVVKDCAIAASCHILNMFDTSPDSPKAELAGLVSLVITLAIEKAMEMRSLYLEEIHYLEPSEN